MKLTWKRSFSYFLLSILFICLLFSSFSCSVKERSKNNRFSLQDCDNIITVLKNEINDDCGFGPLIDGIKGHEDFYTTYYAVETFKLISSKNTSSKITYSISPGIVDQYGEELMDKKDRIDLTELFYFFNVVKGQVKDSRKVRDWLCESIIKLQTKHGFFALDLSQKAKYDETYQSTESCILPTFMAVTVLSELNVDFDKKYLSQWVITEAKKRLLQQDTISKDYTAQLSVLLSICKLLAVDPIEPEYPVSNILRLYENCIYRDLMNSKQVPLFLINTYLDLKNIVLSKPIISSLDTEIVEYIKKCQNEDGGFAFTPGMASHILPTYIAVRYISYCKKDIPKVEKLIRSLSKYRLQNGLFIPISSIGSNSIDTYYAYQLSTLLNAGISEEEKIQFLKRSEDILYTGSIPEILYYLQIKSELSQITDEQKRIALNTGNILINSVSEKPNMHIIVQLLEYIRTLSLIKVELPDDQERKLLKQIIKIQEQYSSLPQMSCLVDCLRLRILYMRNMEDPFLQEDANKLVGKFRKLHIKRTPGMLFLSYYVLSSLKAIEVSVKQEDIDTIYEHIQECYETQGYFKSGNTDSDNVSYNSTYYGIWLMQLYPTIKKSY